MDLHAIIIYTQQDVQSRLTDCKRQYETCELIPLFPVGGIRFNL
jgi:hypothetical protein